MSDKMAHHWFKLILITSSLVAVIAHAEPTLPNNLFSADSVVLKRSVESLIARLGSDKFSEREAAQRRLADIGQSLKKADGWDGRDMNALGRYHTFFVLPVTAATSSDDYEIRARAKKLSSSLNIVRPVGGGADGWLIYQLIEDMRFVLDRHSSDPKVQEALRATSDIIPLQHRRETVPDVLFAAALAKLTEERPVATAEWVLTSDFEERNWLPKASRMMAVKHLVRVWAAKDFVSAYRWCKALKNYDEPGWSPKTGRKYSEGRMLDYHPKNRLFVGAFEELVYYWPEQLPIEEAEELLALYPQHPKSPWAHVTCLRIAQHWSKRDASAMLRWAHELPWQRARSSIYREVFLELGRRDLAVAMECLKDIPERNDREVAASYVVAVVLERDEPVSKRLLASLSKPFRDYLDDEQFVATLRLIERQRASGHKRWMEPVETFLLRMPMNADYGLQDQRAEKFFKSIWDCQDASDAAAAVNGNPPAHVAWPLWASVLGYMWAHRDLDSAILFASHLKPSEARALLIAEILRVLVQSRNSDSWG